MKSWMGLKGKHSSYWHLRQMIRTSSMPEHSLRSEDECQVQGGSRALCVSERKVSRNRSSKKADTVADYPQIELNCCLRSFETKIEPRFFFSFLYIHVKMLRRTRHANTTSISFRRGPDAGNLFFSAQWCGVFPIHRCVRPAAGVDARVGLCQDKVQA